MGAFVGFCTIAILFYYTVVTGWCLKYLVATVFEPAAIQGDAGAYWEGFTNRDWSVVRSGELSLQPVIYHAIAIVIGGLIVVAGVVKGIQRANRVLIPSLFVLLIIAAVRACTLDGAARGIEYLFHVDWYYLSSHETWLAAFSQSAWSAGAGWGLILTYAVYTRKKEDIALNSFLTGLGNNSASLIAGLAVIPVVFAFLPEPEALAACQAGNDGLTFTWLPRLFLGGQVAGQGGTVLEISAMPGGPVFLPLFFLALSTAAISSLISLIELGVRNIMDMGLSRKKALLIISAATFVCGVPSALSMTFFQNQDWVWGVGLLLSGMFFAFAAVRHGVDRLRREQINAEGTDLQVGRWFNLFIPVLIPAEFVGMLGWWFYIVWPEGESFGEQLLTWLQPFAGGNVGTCLFQWAVVIVLFLILNRTLARWSLRGEVEP
jgi:NSS family neurotransmitter:Na+ symporter